MRVRKNMLFHKKFWKGKKLNIPRILNGKPKWKLSFGLSYADTMADSFFRREFLIKQQSRNFIFSENFIDTKFLELRCCLHADNNNFCF